MLYLTIGIALDQCHAKGVLWSCENPRSSWYWLTPNIASLTACEGVKVTHFQACMHGSERDKWTRLVHNIPEMCSLALVCDSLHTHAPWGAARSQNALLFEE